MRTPISPKLRFVHQNSPPECQRIDRRTTLTELADWIGMTLANLSILETGKARATRFSTLNGDLRCTIQQPGDILRFESDGELDPAPNKKNFK